MEGYVRWWYKAKSQKRGVLVSEKRDDYRFTISDMEPGLLALRTGDKVSFDPEGEETRIKCQLKASNVKLLERVSKQRRMEMFQLREELHLGLYKYYEGSLGSLW